MEISMFTQVFVLKMALCLIKTTQCDKTLDKIVEQTHYIK